MEIVHEQVSKIPTTFWSVTQYKQSFILPLLEETHADLLSSMETIYKAPSCEIVSAKRIAEEYKLPKDLFYSILLKRSIDKKNGAEAYKPQPGDIIAIADVRPKSARYLDRPGLRYTIAVVQVVKDFDRFSIRSSKPLQLVEDHNRKVYDGRSLFAVYLINLTTNIRIWDALSTDMEKQNINIIQRVLKPNFVVS